MKKLIYLILGITSLNCMPKKAMKSIEKIILVNHQKVSCQGESLMNCLEIKEILDGVTPDSWSYLYDEIEGFEFETGYSYKLKIKETKLNPKSVPADGSSIKRTLIEVMEKEAVSVPLLNETWKAVLIHGTDEKLVAAFSLNIILKDGVLSGSDGCNQLFSNYKYDSKNIKFDSIGSTKRGCQGDRNIIAKAFTKGIESTASYVIVEDNLTFFDKNRESLIYFVKD